MAKWDHPAYSVAGNPKNFGVAVRTARYRYAEFDGGREGAMLFDEQADPTESKNLIDDPVHQTVKADLAKLAKRHAAPLKP
jgi:iduronate 2-sulfatase